jgi:DNA modification methylase
MTDLIWHNERRKVDELLPYDQNPRRLTNTQRDRLQKSLSQFGLVEIPVINTDNKIIAGHQRLATMKLLGRGQEEIDVRVPNRELNEEEFKQYLLTSNKVTGEWDWAMLEKFEKAMLWDTGFDSKEIDKIFSGKEEEDKAFDPQVEYANIQVPLSRIGEVYQLGRHRVMCGDATKSEDMEKLMDGKQANMVFTDPPYNVDYQGPQHREKIQNDNLPTDEFSEFMREALREAFKACKGVFYICMSSKELWNVKTIFEQEGGHWASFIIWVKNTFTLGRQDWQNRYEPILYGWHGNCKNHYFAGWRNESNVWEGLETLDPTFDGTKTTIQLGEYHLELDGEVTGRIVNKKNVTDIWPEKKPARNPDHPTMKPVKLIAKALKASSVRGESVLDPFAGSGSTLIAAEELDRMCYCMEADPKYVDVIRKRYENFLASRNV